MNTIKTQNYYTLFIVSIKSALCFIVPLTVLIFFIEIAFELNEGGSLALFFTSEFIVNFIFHKLMIVFYFIVFILVYLLRLLIMKLGNSRNKNN